MRNRIKSILNREAREIIELSDTLDYSQVEAVLAAIENCDGKIIFSACGTSAQAAKKIAHTMCCVGCPALFIPPSDALHGGLGVVEGHDLLILITKGGYTHEINEMIRPAHMAGAKVIMVTENVDGEYAKSCDLVLGIRIKEEPDRFNMLATASTLAVIAVFDAICIELMEEMRYTEENFHRIHPEGEVGKRLAERNTGKS